MIYKFGSVFVALVDRWKGGKRFIFKNRRSTDDSHAS